MQIGPKSSQQKYKEKWSTEYPAFAPHKLFPITHSPPINFLLFPAWVYSFSNFADNPSSFLLRKMSSFLSTSYEPFPGSH